MDELRLVLLAASLVLWAMTYFFAKSKESYNSNAKVLSISDFLFLFIAKPPSVN